MTRKLGRLGVGGILASGLDVILAVEVKLDK